MKKIFIGTILIFLLLIPHIGAVEYQAVKDEIEQMKDQMMVSLDNIQKFLIRCLILPILLATIGKIFEFHLGEPILAILCYFTSGFLIGYNVGLLSLDIITELIIQFILVLVVNFISGAIANMIIKILPQYNKVIA